MKTLKSSHLSVASSFTPPPLRGGDTQLVTPKLPAIIKPRQAHIWEREKADHYVEPEWLSIRLFEVEDFNRSRLLWDCCCGWGRIS